MGTLWQRIAGIAEIAAIARDRRCPVPISAMSAMTRDGGDSRLGLFAQAI
jgi:hypothetical protein